MDTCISPGLMTPPATTADTLSTPLQRFLNCYWLRPENAFWMTLRSQVIGSAPFAAPSIDLSCGDGMFMFIHAGGAFDLQSDVFASVGPLDASNHATTDMFDHDCGACEPVITHRPTWRVNSGTDLKPNLLRKAASLRFFERLYQLDHNEPLPIPNESYNTVHCNSVYWVRNVDGFLREMHRILRPGGVALLSVKLDAIRECTLDGWQEQLGSAWLQRINRGRFDCWPATGDQARWAERFEQAGFAISEVTPFITSTHAHIWDVGLRPIASLLIRMANALTPETRALIKADWLEVVGELLEPITKRGLQIGSASTEPVEVLFRLTRC